MDRVKSLLPLLVLLLLPASMVWAAEAPTEAVDGRTIDSAAIDSTADAEPSVDATPILEVATGPADDDSGLFSARFESGWGGGGSCVGTLGYFVAPACQACNINRFDCESACSNRGGVDHFSCGSGGIECVCNDGAYDSCGCW